MKMYFEERNPKEVFEKLLYIKNPEDFILRINSNYAKYLEDEVFAKIIFSFHRTYFVVFPDNNDVLYECEYIYYGGQNNKKLNYMFF